MNYSDQNVTFTSSHFLDLLRSRDHQSVTALVHAYTGQLLRASLGLGFDKNTSKELVQSVWVTFFEVISDFRGQSHIRTFIFGILYNKASELRRDQRRHDPVQSATEVIDSRFDSTGHWTKAPMSPEDAFLGTETLDEIQRCLDLLPLNQRMAFVMKEVEERKSTEISKILGITITNLGVLLYRARKHLKECLLCKPTERKA